VREDFDPARSDVDLLVTYEPGTRRSFFEEYDLQQALEAVFGRPVDLVSDAAIENPYLRRAVDADRRPLFPDR
jgi:predicted nucleotidyltransferase